MANPDSDLMEENDVRSPKKKQKNKNKFRF